MTAPRSASLCAHLVGSNRARCDVGDSLPNRASSAMLVNCCAVAAEVLPTPRFGRAARPRRSTVQSGEYHLRIDGGHPVRHRTCTSTSAEGRP